MELLPEKNGLLSVHLLEALHDVVAAMAAHGYFVYDIAGFIRRPWDGAVALMDLCFARALRGSETEWHPRP